MRKKTMKNDMFYVQYPYRPELEDPDNVIIDRPRCILSMPENNTKPVFNFVMFIQRQMKYKVAISLDSKLYFTYCQLPPRVLCEPDALFDVNKSTDKSSGDAASPVQSPTETGPALARFVSISSIIISYTFCLLLNQKQNYLQNAKRSRQPGRR